MRQDSQVAAFPVAGPENQGAGAVAENESGFLVVVVHHARHQLGTDHQGGIADPGARKSRRGNEGVQGAGTPGVEVVGRHRG